MSIVEGQSISVHEDAAAIGQARPRFELRDVFTKRKILLVNLAIRPCHIRPPASRSSVLCGFADTSDASNAVTCVRDVTVAVAPSKCPTAGGSARRFAHAKGGAHSRAPPPRQGSSERCACRTGASKIAQLRYRRHRRERRA